MITIERLYAKRFNTLVNDLVNDKKEYTQMLSHVDKELSDLLHFMENEKLNAAILAKVNKRIRELRIQRRNIKNSITDINIVLKRTGVKNLQEKVECDYAYRTDCVMELLGEKEDKNA